MFHSNRSIQKTSNVGNKPYESSKFPSFIGVDAVERLFSIILAMVEAGFAQF